MRQNASVEDGFGDLGAQKGQPDQPGGIGVMHTLGCGDFTDSPVFAHQILVQPVRCDDELNQRGIRFSLGFVRSNPIDDHPGLFPHPLELRRDG